MSKRLARKPSTASLTPATRNSTKAMQHLAGRDRPDHHRHQQDARKRNEIRNTQASSAPAAMRARRRAAGTLHACRSIAAIAAIAQSCNSARTDARRNARRTDHGGARRGLTYAEAGVDIDAGNRMVELIKPLVRATARPGADAEIGGFGGLFDLKRAGFSDPVLVAATDGVGTKVKIAIETGRHDTIGIDLVAMWVNDLVVQGAEPLFFLDYFACGKLEPEVGAAVVARHRRGLPAGRLRADRRRDRRNAGPLQAGRLRPRRLRGRRGRARHAAAARRYRGRRRRARPRLLRRALQRLFAGAQGRRASRAELGRARAVRRRRRRSAKRC